MVSKIRSNPEREARISYCWDGGRRTIDEIEEMTGYPRSSVGYYVKKFRRKPGTAHHDYMPKPNHEGVSVEGSHWLMYWKKCEYELYKLMREGSYQKAKELVDAYFAVRRFYHDIPPQLELKKETKSKTSLDSLKYKIDSYKRSEVQDGGEKPTVYLDGTQKEISDRLQGLTRRFEKLRK